MGRLLERIGRACGRHPGRALIGLVSIVALAGLAASRLELEADVMSLLPSGDPVVTTFRQSLEDFGSVDRLLVLVRVPQGQRADDYEAFVERLAGELSALDELASVEYELGDIEELAVRLLPHAPLFLDEASLQRLERRLTAAGMRRRAAELRRRLTSPSGLGREELAVLDPLGLLELVNEARGVASGRDEPGMAAPLPGLDVTSGYLLSRDGRRLLLTAEPIRPAQDIAFDRRLMAAVEGAVRDASESWRQAQAGRGREIPAPEVTLGGGHVIALEDATMIRDDMAVSGLTALALVLALFAWSFRRLGPLVVAVVPLACGVVATFGFAALALGRVGMATSGVAALLIGLAIDFVIVSYARFLEETGRDGDESAPIDQSSLAPIGRMMRTSGPAVVIGAVTSAATFFAFAVTDFRGLRQMGILTGVGILLCLLAVLVALPALLAWRARRGRLPERTGIRGLHAEAATWLVGLSLRRPRTVLAVGAGITVAALAVAVRVEFEDDIEALRSPSNRGIQVAEEVAAHFGAGFDHLSVILSRQGLEPVLAATAEAVDRLTPLVERGTVGRIEAVTDYIPPPDRQRRAIEWLEERRDGLADPERVRREMEAALFEVGLRPSAFERGLELLQAAMRVARPLALDDEAIESSELLVSYLARRDGEWRSLVKLFPPGGPEGWGSGPPPAVRRALATDGLEAAVTSAGIVSEHLRRRVLGDALLAGVIGLVAVAFILWLDLRRISHVALTLAPLAIGIVWMLGAMANLGVALNFMSIFVVTMVIGIGVDYGVHVVHRWREGGDPDATVAETGKAVTLAALSTMAGFGSMSLSRYPGLESTGTVALLGALATAVVALTLLPAALALMCGDATSEASERVADARADAQKAEGGDPPPRSPRRTREDPL